MAARLQQIVDSLGAQLQRAVAIDDSALRLIVYSPHYGTVDQVRYDSIMHREAASAAQSWVLSQGIGAAGAYQRLPANDELGMLPRIAVPVRCQGLLLGFLFLIDADNSVTDAELELAVNAANTAGAVLYQDQLLAELERSRERELLRDLLADDEALAGAAAAELVETNLVASTGPVYALVTRVVGADVPGEALRLALSAGLDEARRSVSPRKALTLARTDHGVLLVCGTEISLLPGALAGLGETLRSALMKAVNGHDAARVIVGVGDAHPSLPTVARSYRRAQTAADVAAIVPTLGDVVGWDQLGVYRTLAQIPRGELESGAIHPGLRRLIEADATEQLVDTLEVFLDNAGDVKRTAGELCIHRTSLYYRLGRVEQLADVDLGNGNDRLALHLGLKIARLAGIRQRRITSALESGLTS